MNPGEGEFAERIYRRRTFFRESRREPGHRGCMPLFLRKSPACPCREPAGSDRRCMTGRSMYLGGETPVHPAREAGDSSTLQTKAVEVLGCQGYCGVDVVVADKVYVVDVNPRITTSLVGIAACMEEEIAESLLRIEGQSTGSCAPHRKVRLIRTGRSHRYDRDRCWRGKPQGR